MVVALLGKLVGPSYQTLERKVMNFACICVEIDLSNPLPDSLEIHAGAYSWVQQLDYDTFPFRCRLCHEYGHLQRRCPRAKFNEFQTSQSPRNPTKVDKGKAPISDSAGNVVSSEHFTLVKT